MTQVLVSLTPMHICLLAQPYNSLLAQCLQAQSHVRERFLECRTATRSFVAGFRMARTCTHNYSTHTVSASLTHTYQKHSDRCADAISLLPTLSLPLARTNTSVSLNLARWLCWQRISYELARTKNDSRVRDIVERCRQYNAMLEQVL